jgi:hypothetical protein
MIYKPICAGKTGRLKTYGNACLAALDGALIIADRRCPLMCVTVFAPVCAQQPQWTSYAFSGELMTPER